ncbi:hypothetical protein M569_01362 [Genlisea aurea]|uniref:CYTH domain-containing protein n=1 Tax=Genlisea aurea TaxID=192259 RepID=S8D210_9LAMI|nr:hypothetical protein M569_01362 [Genlisea aurea]
MAKENSINESQRRNGLLKDQVKLVKRKDSERYEIAPIPDNLSFEKGFFAVIRACQLLAQKNEGLTVVGIAGPSGAGKTAFTDKILNFMPSIAVISMDNYNDSSRIIDGNFDDPRLTDYDTLLQNIRDLKDGKPVDIPIYDFKSSTRTGYRRLDVPSSHILLIEGIYGLSEKLRPLLDIRVSVTGGVHFDLVKRVLRDIGRAGQQPEEIIQQISETVYPMYKAFIEPDLQTAHIKIRNKFNPFTGFQSPTYVLKSSRNLTAEEIRCVMPQEHTESKEQIYDIYLLPPGEDPDTCQSYLRMRNKDGKYNLMFEEWVTDAPFVISPRITFEVSVKLLGGLMALGYTIATILKRNSHIFRDERVCVKIDWLEQLNRHYVQGWDRQVVKQFSEQLGLEASYVPRTYIEQIQLEKLVDDVMALPDDLKTKLSVDDDSFPSPMDTFRSASVDGAATKLQNLRISHSYSTNRDIATLSNRSRESSNRAPEPPREVVPNQEARLSEQMSNLNDRMDDLTSRIEELNSKLTTSKNTQNATSSPNPAEPRNGTIVSSYFSPGLEKGFITKTFSSAQLTVDAALVEELTNVRRSQRQAMHQLESISRLLSENLRERKRASNDETERLQRRSSAVFGSLAVGGLAVVMLLKSGFLSRG